MLTRYAGNLDQLDLEYESDERPMNEDMNWLCKLSTRELRMIRVKNKLNGNNYKKKYPSIKKV